MKKAAGVYIERKMTSYVKRDSTHIISENSMLKTSETFSTWSLYADRKLTIKIGSLVSRSSTVPMPQNPNKNIEFINQHAILTKAYRGAPAGAYTISASTDDNDQLANGFAGQIIGANNNTKGILGTVFTTILKANPKTVIIKVEADLSIPTK